VGGTMRGGSKNVLGSVQSLWRYPVKSMLGEELESTDVTERGLQGDRTFAIVDESSNKVASAKNPREWGSLLSFKTTLVGGEKAPEVQITLRDGAVISSWQTYADQKLSAALGKKVKLAAIPPKAPKFEEYWPNVEGLLRREKVTNEPLAVGAPRGTFFDLAPLHLLTTATLARLRELHPQGQFEVARFRPNIVVEPASSEKCFAENGWVGRLLGIGEEVRLSILIPCPRCVMTTLAQGDLPADVEVLLTVAKNNRVMIAALGAKMPSVGVYATVVRGGTVRRGDPVHLLGSSHLRRAAVFARAYWRVLNKH
jgi:MOSC domain-containing protein